MGRAVAAHPRCAWRLRRRARSLLAPIIESVERGGDPVSISVAVHSGAVVSGYVRRSEFFASVTKDGVRRTHEQASFAAKSRVTREIKDGMQVQVERIDSIYAGRLDDSSDDADSLMLSNVTMLWSSGDGL